MANFYCEYCGLKYDSVQTLTSLNCHKHPNGSGKHKLYEGSEKSQYTCKYCGVSNSNFQTLVSLNCQKHPNGAGRGKHSPAL